MPRLDVWLIENGKFSSRQAAKRAIKNGLVLLNGEKCKPSTHVSEKDIVELLDTQADVPQGFQKLKELDELTHNKLLHDVFSALDIGSSAGGFLTYLAEKGINVVGIEISERFAKELHSIVKRYSQVSIVFADAFDMDKNVITANGQLDLLIVDVTTEPEGTLKLIEKYAPLLRKGGRMLAAFKISHKSEKLDSLKSNIFDFGFEQIQELVLDKTRQEIHITAIYR